MSTAVAIDNTLSVLRETVPNPKFAVQAGGARLVSVLRSTGWNRFPRQLTTEQIVRIPAVIICLDVLAQDIAKVPFRMYEKLKNNGKRELGPEEHPVATLLATEPNRFHTWYEYFEMTILHLGVVQNAYTAKRIDPRTGYAKELIPVMPARQTTMAVMPEDDPVNGMGFFCYRVDRNTPAEKIQFAQLPEIFLEYEFIHFRGRMFDGLTGYSNLDVGAKAFGVSDELLDYTLRMANGDGQMPGVFQMGKESGDSLSNEAFQRLKEQLGERVRKMREEQLPIVLEEGMTFQEIAMDAQQAEVAKSRDAAIVDTARIFRIPPHKIMHLVNVKYENMETLEKSYVNDTLIPYCERIEQRMARSLLTAADRAKYFFQFDRRAMLLNDMQKLVEAGQKMTQVGAIDLDEFRALFGYNELPNGSGKIRLIPSTFNAVDDKNEVVIPAGAQPQGEDKAKGTEASNAGK